MSRSARAVLAFAALLAAAGTAASCRESPAAKPAGAPADPAQPAAEPEPKQRIPDVDKVPEITFVGPRGSGPPIEHGDAVLVHLIAKLADGTSIHRTVPEGWEGTRRAFDPLPDSPEARNVSPAPFGFEAGRGTVPRGLDLATRALRIGDHARFTVHSDLAYGERGAPPIVPPGAEISYEMWVLQRIPRPVAEILRPAPENARRIRTGDTVRFHLRAWLPDGKPIDDSRRPRTNRPEAIPYQVAVLTRQIEEGVDLLLLQLRYGDLARGEVHWFWDRGPRAREFADVPIPAMTSLTYEIEVLPAEDE